MPLKKFGSALAACAVFTCAAMAVRAQGLQPQPQPRTQPKAVLQPRTQPGVVAQPGAAVQPHAGAMPAAVTRAIAVIHATKSGGDVSGEVTFTQTARGVRVQAEIRGLKPGKHGFHIHEYGDCSSPDAMSAGAHFNPAMTRHAGPQDPNRHEGDLGNITANEKGVARLDLVDPALSFMGPASILGRSVIVHEKEDDLKSQPAGNAGARLGCGVIGIAKAAETAAAGR